MRYIILFILLLATSFGCARKQTPTGKIRLNLGAATAGTTLNGVYIWGLNKTFGLTFAHHIVGDGRDLEFPLKPGVWNFRVVAWSGAGLPMFEGTTRCGNSPDISFQSGDVDVPIHINSDCSNHPRISDPDFIETNGNGNQLKTMRLVSCRSLVLVSDNSSVCDNAYLGDTKSFRVILPSYSPRPDMEIGPFAPESLRSDCQNTTNGSADTNLRIPVGNGSPESPRVYIESFDQVDCTGNVQFRAFPHGLFAAEGIHGKLFNLSNPPPKAVFYLKHGEALGKGDLSPFGNGADGDVTVNSLTSLASMDTAMSGGGVSVVPSTTRTWSSSRRVTAMVTDAIGTKLTVSAAFGSNAFRPDDEIMWHVSMATSNTACDSEIGAENHLHAGSYGFVRISSTPTALTLVVPYVFPLTGINTNLNRDLLFANGGQQEQCVIQIIRVPNLNSLTLHANLTLQTSSFLLGASATPATGHGGILPIRLKGQLVIDDGFYLYINQKYQGYPYGDFVGSDFRNFQGVGPTGFTQNSGFDCGSINCSNNNGMGGGVGEGQSSPNTPAHQTGGGGGGHIGSGGTGGYEPGGYPGYGGSTIAPSVPWTVLMGASGGHGAGDASISAVLGGGTGGGIIILAAKEIIKNPIASTNASITLEANGQQGGLSPGGTYGGNGGGGGAGGSVYLITQFTNINHLTTSASGGNGRDTTFPTGGGGGGGGGGKIVLQSCIAPSDGIVNPPNINGGARGATAGIANLATVGGSGFASLAYSLSHPFCPQ